MHRLHLAYFIFVLTVGYIRVKAFPTEVQCGATVSSRKGRIANGDPAQLTQIPWIASIKHRGRHICGGTIVSSRFILTAAHCFENELINGHIVEAREDSELSNYVVTLGEYTLGFEEAHSLNYSIHRIIFHKDYRKVPIINDILLLELKEQIKWTDHIQPICLPKEDTLVSDEVVAAGWGWDYNPNMSELDNSKLRYVQLKVFGNDECNDMYQKRKLRTRLIKSQMCAGRMDKLEAQPDTNGGDSGGPLLMNFGGREVLVGVTSAGTSESIPPRAPGIYTRVFEYLDWIREHSYGVLTL